MADELLLAHWNLASRDHHRTRAKEYLIQLLSGGEGMECLLDLISNAITDVHDIDATTDDYAVAVFNALVKEVVP
jgi:hypothetical protein